MKDLLERVKDEEGKLKDKYEGKQRAYLYMKLFYGLFISWMGYNILMSEQLNEKNQKYLKESLKYVKINITEYYFPNLLTNEKINKYFDYNTLFNKVNIIIEVSCYLFIVGGILIAIGYKLGKSIVLVTLLLNVFFIYNGFYYKNESLKAMIFKYWSLIGGAYYL